MPGSRVCYACIALLAGLFGPVIAQCDGSTAKITAGVGEIKSPNYDTWGEYGKSADCTWEFSPPSDGKDYALRITVEQLKLYVVKDNKKHCLGSNNLTIDNEQTPCDRYVHVPMDDGEIPANHFCKSYYSSPACSNVSGTQGCETWQQTSYPVAVRYDSDGRTHPNVTIAGMHFKIRYEFFECPKEESVAATSTSRHSTSLYSITSRAEQDTTHKIQKSATSASDIEHSTSPETVSLETSPFQTSTIILSVVVAVFILAAAGVFAWKRVLTKKPQTTNKTEQRESPDGIYDNDPSPSNQENRAYEEITDKSEYETVKSANVEEDPYITPNATPTGGEYEVPIQLAPRQYENVA